MNPLAKAFEDHSLHVTKWEKKKSISEYLKKKKKVICVIYLSDFLFIYL